MLYLPSLCYTCRPSSGNYSFDCAYIDAVIPMPLLGRKKHVNLVIMSGLLCQHWLTGKKIWPRFNPFSLFSEWLLAYFWVCLCGNNVMCLALRADHYVVTQFSNILSGLQSYFQWRRIKYSTSGKQFSFFKTVNSHYQAHQTKEWGLLFEMYLLQWDTCY